MWTITEPRQPIDIRMFDNDVIRKQAKGGHRRETMQKALQRPTSAGNPKRVIFRFERLKALPELIVQRNFTSVANQSAIQISGDDLYVTHLQSFFCNLSLKSLDESFVVGI